MPSSRSSLGVLGRASAAVQAEKTAGPSRVILAVARGGADDATSGTGGDDDAVSAGDNNAASSSQPPPGAVAGLRTAYETHTASRRTDPPVARSLLRKPLRDGGEHIGKKWENKFGSKPVLRESPPRLARDGGESVGKKWEAKFGRKAFLRKAAPRLARDGGESVGKKWEAKFRRTAFLRKAALRPARDGGESVGKKWEQKFGKSVAAAVAAEVDAALPSPPMEKGGFFRRFSPSSILLAGFRRVRGAFCTKRNLLVCAKSGTGSAKSGVKKPVVQKGKRKRSEDTHRVSAVAVMADRFEGRAIGMAQERQQVEEEVEVEERAQKKNKVEDIGMSVVDRKSAGGWK